MVQTKHIQVSGYIINNYNINKAMKNAWPLVAEGLFPAG